jgi:hypothetical protein
MVQGDSAVAASALRRRAFELLGRDSETLSERFFNRVLRDAHDAEIIDLRRRGDDFEVALPAQVAPVAEQLNRAAAARSAPAASTSQATPMRRGMGPRGIPAKGRGGRSRCPRPSDGWCRETRRSLRQPEPAAEAPAAAPRKDAAPARGEAKSAEATGCGAEEEVALRARKGSEVAEKS